MYQTEMFCGSKAIPLTKLRPKSLDFLKKLLKCDYDENCIFSIEAIL